MNKIMVLLSLLVAVNVQALSAAFLSKPAGELEQRFLNPPEPTAPWVYWYWISGNISRDGITADLEAMKRVGIGAALIGNINLPTVPAGPVAILGEEWRELMHHAIREGGRIGVDIGLFNCPGWSMAGGPWVPREKSMRCLRFTETQVEGPGPFTGMLPAPERRVQDVAVLAYRLDGAEVFVPLPARFSLEPEGDASALGDGDPGTSVKIPAGDGARIRIRFEEPSSVRSIRLTPGREGLHGFAVLSAVLPDGDTQMIERIRLGRPRWGMRDNQGFWVHGPVSVSFPPAVAREFILAFESMVGNNELAGIEVSTAPLLDDYVEKQLGKMHQDPVPEWGSYDWTELPEPDAQAFVVPAGEPLDLTQLLKPEGSLDWDIPEGRWLVLRLALSQVGTMNGPAAKEAQGWEIDKMSAETARWHVGQHAGTFVREMPPDERASFKYLVADSWEKGSQNWSDDSMERFRQRYGYDPAPWFPVLAGHIVGSVDQSERFLWDLRRFVADEVADGFVAGMVQGAEDLGLELWFENYGHAGFPGEFLQFGGRAHRISGEFWPNNDLGMVEVRGAASAAHIYGKPVVSAEAFTLGSRLFGLTPASLKRKGDWALSEGINHWVLHVYMHQPDDRKPGIHSWFGTEFNRHNTWFEKSEEWIRYNRRAQALLQQGRHVADVALFIGEDAPRMDGPPRSLVPPGYDFDYINGEVLREKIDVRDGRWTLPDGKSYRVLHLPDSSTMRPELLARLAQLVRQGGVLSGTPPERSPSLQNFPRADAEVRALASSLWGPLVHEKSGSVSAGEGTVFRGVPLAEVLSALNVPPDVRGLDPAEVRWIHRKIGDDEVYFIANQSDVPRHINPVFRVQGKLPELWYPESGRMVKAGAFELLRNGTKVRLFLQPAESVLVVFRPQEKPARSVVGISLDGRRLDAEPPPSDARHIGNGEFSRAREFTMGAWVRPAVGTAASPGFQLEEVNAVTPLREGHRVDTPPGSAFVTLSAGTNGVAVLVSGPGTLGPLLEHRCRIDDWTHVAVVRQQDRVLLYLNGDLVETVNYDSHTLYSVASVDGGRRNPMFFGETTGVSHHDEALDPTGIGALMAESDPRRMPPVPCEVARHDGGGFLAELFRKGNYVFELSDGQTIEVNAGDLPESIELGGPWDLSLAAAAGGSDALVLDRLEPLSMHPDPKIRHFSGSAVYKKRFDAPAPLEGQNIRLDCGDASQSVVRAVLNGTDLGIRWKAPYVFDTAGALRGGHNELLVEVTGTWRNRLVGGLREPGAFVDSKSQPFLAAPKDAKLRAKEPLAPSGLSGPVRLVFSKQVFF